MHPGIEHKLEHHKFPKQSTSPVAAGTNQHTRPFPDYHLDDFKTPLNFSPKFSAREHDVFAENGSPASSGLSYNTSTDSEAMALTSPNRHSFSEEPYGLDIVPISTSHFVVGQLLLRIRDLKAQAKARNNTLVDEARNGHSSKLSPMQEINQLMADVYTVMDLRKGDQVRWECVLPIL
jgi:hypothetical protein